MTLASIALVVVSGVCHAAWNLMLKGSSEKGIIAWWLMAIVGVVLLPFAIVTPLPPDVVKLALVSGATEAVYFVLIAIAYQTAHFSIVYPVSRGTAPLMAALLAFLIAGERLSAHGFAGVLIVVAGVVLMTFPVSGETLRARDLRFALAIGLCIAVYSTVDAVAVRRVPISSYLGVVFLVAALISLPLVLRRRPLRALLAPLRTERRAPLVFILMAVSYACALAAFRVAPVAYVAAAREVSIPIGFILGAHFFAEPMHRRGVAGAFAMLVGMAILALT